MKIDRTSWHCRLYLYMLIAMGDFLDKTWRYSHRRESTDLCHYVRTLVVYFPLLMLWRVLIPLWVAVAVIGFPVYKIGALGTVLGIAAVALILGAIVGLIVLCIHAEHVVKERRCDREDRQPSVIVAYYHAWHRRVCPLVDW